MADVVSRTDLEEAKQDLQTIEDVANGSATFGGDGLVHPRLGGNVKTLAKVIGDIGDDASSLLAPIRYATTSALTSALSGLTPGQVVIDAEAGEYGLVYDDGGSNAFEALFPVPVEAGCPFDFVTNFWPLTENGGTVITDEIGGKAIDFADASYSAGTGTATWRDGMLVLDDYWFWTPSEYSGRSAFVVFETDAGVTAYPMTIATNGGWSTGLGRSTTNSRRRVLSGFGITQLIPRWRDGGGGDVIGLREGAPGAAYFEKASDFSNQPIFFNANRADGAGMATGEYRLIAFGLMDKAISLDEMKALREWLARRIARDKALYLTPDVCPNDASVVWWDGESTNHTTLTMALEADVDSVVPASVRRQNLDTYLLTTANGYINAIDTPVIRRLSYETGGTWSGYLLGNEDAYASSGSNPGVRARKMGPLIGFAERSLYRERFHERLFHFKLARGSTNLCPSDSALAAGGSISTRYYSVARAEANTTIATDPALAHSLILRGFYYMEAKLRKEGWGIRHLTRVIADGINDAGDLAAGVLTSDSVFQGWLQDQHDYLKRMMGLSSIPTVIVSPHLPVPGAAETYAAQLSNVTGSDSYKQGYTNDAAGQLKLDNLLYIRGGVTAWAAAEDDVIVELSGDDYELNSAGNDPTHPSLAGLRAMGGDVRDSVDLTSPLVEAFDDETIDPTA